MYFKCLTVRSSQCTQTHAHTLCGDECSSGQCAACCWHSKSIQINNRDKKVFSCRSTSSTPNTKSDDSAVRCPLSAVDTGVEHACPIGATYVKAWNNVPRPRWQLTSSCALYRRRQQTADPHIWISSSAQCHLYLSRSWWGWTVIRYAIGTHIDAVNQSSQQQSVRFPCYLSLVVLIPSVITSVAHNEFW